MLAVAQAADLLPEQPLQPLLALDQRQLSHALAIQEQKIEGEEHELIGAALIHGRLQPAEDRYAVGIERAQLAVDVCGLHLQGLKGLDRATVPVRPVEPRARQQLRLAAVDSGVHAVAVELDLVQPAVTGRRLVYEARELRLDPLRWPRCRSHESSLAQALDL